MSSLAYPREAPPRARRDVPTMLSAWGADVLLAVALTLLGAVLLAEVNGDFNVDSWLALVTGREIWQNGLPHIETLTAMSRGDTWTDQQWLAQLLYYAIYRGGGLGLLATVNVVLLVGPIAAATVAARRLGAPFRSVLILLPVILTMVTPSREVRTQELAIPLFVALGLLLSADSRRPTRRVLWCLPILALWANLHGTVTLGALLVVIRGLMLGAERRGMWRAPAAWRMPVALVIGAPLACLVTPYGLAIIGYYHATMLSDTLRHFVVEWQPVTVVPTTAASVFITAAIGLWAFGRNPGRTTSWEKLAFLVLAAGSIEVVRNALFFGLFALTITPVALAYGPTEASPRAAGLSDRRRAAINGVLALCAVAALAVTVVATLVRPDSVVQDTAQQPGLLTAVQRTTADNPRLRVLADEHFADWLLWRDPALAGRVANDVRFELLSGHQVSLLEKLFGVMGTGWKQGARGYRLLVLDTASDQPAISAFLKEPGRRVLFDAAGQIVILRTAREAAA